MSINKIQILKAREYLYTKNDAMRRAPVNRKSQQKRPNFDVEPVVTYFHPCNDVSLQYDSKVCSVDSGLFFAVLIFIVLLHFLTNGLTGFFLVLSSSVFDILDAFSIDVLTACTL